MKSRPAIIAVILFTIFLSMVGIGIAMPVLPLYAKQLPFKATDHQIGWLIGVYSLMQFLFSAMWGRISDKVGRRPVLLISTIGSVVGFVLMGGAQTLLMLFIARIIDGISGANISTAQAAMADVTTPEERSKYMAMVGATFGIGFIAGPVIGAVASQWSHTLPFYIAAGLCALNAVLIHFYLPETLTAENKAEAHKNEPLSTVLRHASGSLLIICIVVYFLSIAGFSIMTTVYALFNEKRFGMDAAATGYNLGFIGLVAVIVQGGLMRRLLPRFGEVPIALAGAVLLAIGFYLLPSCPDKTALYWIASLFSVGNSLVMPSINGLVSRHTEAAWQGRVMGILQSAGSLGRFVGPLLAGWLLAFDGDATYARTALWTAAGLMVLTGFGILLLPMGQRRMRERLATANVEQPERLVVPQEVINPTPRA